MTIPPDHLSAALAGRYRIERELGRGGMATVFLAHDLKHGRPVALKLLHPELSAVLGPERFLREIRIAAQLQHPHILTLIDSGELSTNIQGPETTDQRPTTLLYYVMPYVEGESLRTRLTREGTLSPGETARILRDVLDALAHAHRHGIVHRDVKPENVMLSGRHALVVDFGVAKAASVAGDIASGGTLTTLGLAVGTPAYMAPEQATGQSVVDGRADLYAVGALGYEILSGRTPFSGNTPQAILAAHVSRTPEPLGPLRPDAPAELAAAIMRCLEKDPADRCQSAEELLERLEGFDTPGTGITSAGPAQRGSRAWPPRGLAAAGALALALGAWLWVGPGRRARERAWVHEQAIPRVLSLADSGDWEGAYALARKADAKLPGDSLFNATLPRFARRYRIRTTPAGAEVWRKAYDTPESTWVLLGRTPLDALVALSGGGGGQLDDNRLRIRAPGYRTLDLVGFPFGDIRIPLDRENAIPPEMVRVAGGKVGLQYPGFENREPIMLSDYLMDRFEVTNRDFKRFVDAGGYRRQELWQERFLKDGREIPWEGAMALMTDRTGRTGPSTWEAGDYPAGKAQDPVAGVSWYEAMAYARFAGKSLPTVAHWNRAASVRNSAWIVPASNFSGQGTVPVGNTRGISAFGTYDMAGNVREWCLNASGGERFILGGGWNDSPYLFNDTYTQPPLDRSAGNGIRLVRYPPGDSTLGRAAAPIPRTLRDFLHVRPVSDAVFAAYRQMYQYDRGPLNPRLMEKVDEGDWVRELVRVDAAYAGDSLLLYLYLPKRGMRPLPVVVFFPPGSAIVKPGPQRTDAGHFDFLLKSGRAVLYPVYKGTYQRRDSLSTDTQDSTFFYRDHVIMWAKDLRRGVDYLETRPEVSTANLAYFGVSWGGALGGLLPAVEPRIRVALLEVAGLDFPPIRPEVDPVNFLPRITIPTLMINGRYDFYFPVETSQVPMFRLLGTPADRKRHVIEEGSHFVPRLRLIHESLAWLDRYQPTTR
jgi:hypothetical protein